MGAGGDSVVTPTENSCQASLGPQRPERGAPQVTAGLRGGQGPHGLNIPKTQPFRLSVVLCFHSVPQPHPHPECVIVSLLQASCAIFCPSPAHSLLGHMCPALSWQGRFTAGRSLSPSCFTSLSSLPRGTFAELLNPAFCKVTSFRPSAPLTWVLSWTG
jgi:hypothetical protein